MKRTTFLALALLLGPGWAFGAEPQARLKVLFLGDRGHHRPADRAEQLIPMLASRGIDVTYTEDLGMLDPARLAEYQALIVYANSERIEPSQEKALLDYVAGGGGFVPIHCASYCFLNSEPYIALVGAQFRSHGTGEFDTEVVDSDHPITAGLQPFRTWDETYVHHKHNEADRHVLQVRAEGDGREPWTWTRTHGKGRVFYTAYGHDARTWGNPGFHDLIERGIRWAAQKGEVFDSRPRVAEGLKPFRFEDAGDRIPVYLAGEKWGTQGEPRRTMQRPLDPEESHRHLALPAGFRAELFASEPLIGKPLCMAWDHKGRLWLVETRDYPNELQEPGKGRDRIVIVEDRDGDGRGDTKTVFAETLSIPTSLAFARGGVVVHQAPETLFLKDTDGDDKADVREVLLSGWGTRDTHAGPSNLKYGHDNWLYGIVGYSAFEGEVGGERHDFRQGFYRFRPDGSKLEFLRSTSNNSWGVGLSEEGLLFGSTANGCPSVFMPVPNRYYESVRGSSPTVLPNIADSNRFWPVTENVRQVDWHGGFTAAAGHALYTARNYPSYYWNATAFVTEPTGHLVSTFSLHRRGADFASHNAWNLVASDDEWTAPIAAEVGPDGNVWVIDWYNYIVQHNPTPEGFRNGKGNAYETPLRDKTRGRIYRIVHEDAKPAPAPKLSHDDPAGLVAALGHDNMLWRLHAQRLLIERGKRDVVAELGRKAADRSVDAIGLNPGVIHALWTLHGLGAIADEPIAKAAAVEALGHPSAGVRRNALQVLEGDEQAVRIIGASNLLGDPDAQVRLAALLSLADARPSPDAAERLVQALRSGRVGGDRVLLDAATAAAAAHDRHFLEQVPLHKGEGETTPALLAVTSRVAEHYARGVPADTAAGLLAGLVGAERPVAEAVVAGLARGWPMDRPARIDAETEATVAKLLPNLSNVGRGQLVSLATRWGVQNLDRFSADLAAAFLAQVDDASRPIAERRSAALELIDLRKDNAEAASSLIERITPRTDPALANGLVEAVGRSQAAGAADSLLAALPTLTPSVRPSAIRVLLGRSDWTSALVADAARGRFDLSGLALDQQQALAAHPDAEIAAQARALLGRGGGLPDADRQKVIDELSPLVLKTGDVARGRKVFTDQCAKCHKHGGEGGNVGPDLTGMAAHPRAELLIHILDPSRSIEGNYTQYSLVTTEGRVLNGLLASETRTSIELVDSEGKKTVVLRDDIDELAASKKSLMPEGFEKQVGAEGIADLLAFLTQRGQYLPLDLHKVATIASTRGMFYDRDSPVERLVFPDWTTKVVDGIPFQLVDPQGARVPNVVLLNGPQGQFPPQMPRSVTLPCNTPARAIHLLSGISGWGHTGGEPSESVSLIVRLRYADGTVEDHPLLDGVHFADYIRPIDVPGSKRAFNLAGRQVRYLQVKPGKTDPIEQIELLKGTDATAPIVVAVTVEVAQ